MSARTRRWIGWSVGLAVVALLLAAARRFPFHAAEAALLHADLALIALATAINLTSLVFKGTAWHRLLRTVAPARWRVTQEATIVGSAVNSVSVSGIGEGARVQFVVARDRLPVGEVLTSLVWSRVVEGLALIALVALAPLALRVPPALHRAQLLVLALGAATLLIAYLQGWARIAGWLRPAWRARLVPLVTMASSRNIGVPLLLSVGNWIAQWLTFHYTLRALHIPASYAASFTALLASNIGGIVRLTPANVGITQASMVVALLPFGVAPEQAVAAGLALQALQVLPVLAMGAAIGGWRSVVPDRRTPVAARALTDSLPRRRAAGA